jgi:sec-independent protein translocase protein TatB
MDHIAGMDFVCASLAFIDGLGTPEMALIFVVVLVLFGGHKLPEFARGLGKTMREFKKAASGVEDEFKRALEEDERKTTAAQLAAASATATPQLLPAAETPVHDEHGYGGEPGPHATTTASPTASPGELVASTSESATAPTIAADSSPATSASPDLPEPSAPPSPSNTPPPAAPTPKRSQPNPAQLPDYL